MPCLLSCLRGQEDEEEEVTVIHVTKHGHLQRARAFVSQVGKGIHNQMSRIYRTVREPFQNRAARRIGPAHDIHVPSIHNVPDDPHPQDNEPLPSRSSDSIGSAYSIMNGPVSPANSSGTIGTAGSIAGDGSIASHMTSCSMRPGGSIMSGAIGSVSQTILSATKSLSSGSVLEPYIDDFVHSALDTAIHQIQEAVEEVSVVVPVHCDLEELKKQAKVIVAMVMSNAVAEYKLQQQAEAILGATSVFI